MSTDNFLSFKRLGLLIRNELYLQKKQVLLLSGMIVILLILFSGVSTVSEDNYMTFLYIGGFIMTSYAFGDLHNQRKAYFYLSLPCSSLERFLSKWLLTSVGYALGLLLLCYLYSLLSSLLVSTVFFGQHHAFDFFHMAQWKNIALYFVLQSVVLLGSAVFKRFALLKTGFTVGLFALTVALFTASMTWLFCAGNCINPNLISIVELSLDGGYFAFWVILAPLCWYLTYLRITEAELI